MRTHGLTTWPWWGRLGIFTAETLNILAKPDHPGLMGRLDLECRLEIRIAFMWRTEKILDNEMDESAARLRDALLGRIPRE